MSTTLTELRRLNALLAVIERRANSADLAKPIGRLIKFDESNALNERLASVSLRTFVQTRCEDNLRPGEVASGGLAGLRRLMNQILWAISSRGNTDIPVFAASDDAKMILASQFDELSAVLLGQLTSEQLARPMNDWRRPSDKHLPSFALRKTTGELLRLRFSTIASRPGTGTTKLLHLINLLRSIRDRTTAQQSVAGATQAAAATAPIENEIENEATLSDRWEQARTRIEEANLGHVPIGRVAPRLQDLPKNLWSCSFSEFTCFTMSEIERLPVYGAFKTKLIVEAGIAVAAAIPSIVPADLAVTAPMRSGFAHLLEELSSCGIEGQNSLAAARQVVEHLVRLLSDDLGESIADVVRERVFEDRTLQQIADMQSVSREMVRQRLLIVANAMAVRWPEGEGRLLSTMLRLNYSSDLHAIELLARTLEAAYDSSARRYFSEKKLLGGNSAALPNNARQTTSSARSEALFNDDDDDGYINSLIVDLLAPPKQ